jgi:biotin carboxyl carrier protein
MVQAKVADKIFEITKTENGFLVNGNSFQWDRIKISEGYFHIIYQDQNYRAEVISADKSTKIFVLKINGKNYSVDLKDKFDLLLEKMGMNTAAAGKINHIKAPMPGLIIDLKVKEGDLVKQGDQLLILEAMKMENILKSHGEGKVKTVKVKKGDTVEKGQVLIEF